MHELPRNRPAVRQMWIKFIQFKRADFLAAPQHTHLCGKHFSECDFANPMEYCMGFALKLTRCSGTLSKSCLTGSNWYGCILVGLSDKVSVSSLELELADLFSLCNWRRKLHIWSPNYTSMLALHELCKWLLVTGRLICTTAFSFWVKLLALQFSHIHMCTAQQETWTDLQHLRVAETVLAVPCCRLMFMTYIFRYCGLQILKII